MRKPRKRIPAPATPVRVNDQVLTGAQTAALRAAEDCAQSTAYADRARAAARFQALEAELERRRREAEVRRGLDESLTLARGRGEAVEISRSPDAITHVRIRSRDGLETLARSEAITPRQLRAGMLYRDLYEAHDPERGLRSQMTAPAFMQGGASSASAGPPEAWAERRLRLSASMAAIEAKVRNADRNGRAVDALRQVAGHARCVSHMARGGGGQAAYRQALILALNIVAGHFGVS